LDLRVLSPSAIQNPDRKALYEKIGVTEATPSQVRGSIFVFFEKAQSISTDNIVQLLRYLYLTHKTMAHAYGDYKKVWLATTSTGLKPHSSVIYLPGIDHPYSPGSLLPAQDNAPGFNAVYLREEILEGAPDHPDGSNPFQISWKKWMVDYIGVHDRLSLISPTGDGLSDPFLYVFNHRPDKFLGLFEHLWGFEGTRALRIPGLVSKIRNFSAKQLCTVAFSLKLEDTWLPSPHLKTLVERYMEQPEQFPFLRIEGSDAGQWPGMKWNFLAKHFSVGQDEGMEFLLEMLTCIKRSCPSPSSIRQAQRVFELYIAIYAKLATSNDQTKLRTRIRQAFVNYLPPQSLTSLQGVL
jgi:hypothetical protein